jgi:hypothetical protein
MANAEPKTYVHPCGTFYRLTFSQIVQYRNFDTGDKWKKSAISATVFRKWVQNGTLQLCKIRSENP